MRVRSVSTARITSFETWECQVPAQVRNGPLWASAVYRKALFLYDLCRADCDVLLRDERGRAVARQLTRSCGAIAANMEEGYGRGFGRDYARILSIALGEARETQGWYYRARRMLSPEVLEHRLGLTDEIIALLVRTIQQQRRSAAQRTR